MEGVKTLNRCKDCGQLKNEKLLCICSGIICHKCKKNKMRKPISNYYDEKEGKIYHVPWSRGIFPCAECVVPQKD